MKNILFILAILFSFNANSKHIKDALYLEMSDSGFNLINDQLPQILNGYLNKVDFPDISFSVPGIGTAIARDIKFGIELNSIKLRPKDGYLDIDSVIRNLRVYIGNIRIQDYFTGLIGVNCYNTNVYLSNNSNLPFSTKLDVKIRDRKIRVNPKDLNFYIKEDQFKTIGPSRCASLLNPNAVFVQIAVTKIIQSSRPMINMALKVISKTYGSLINKVVNDIVNNFSIPIILPDILIAPETRLLASGFPSMLEITSNGIKLKLDASLKRGSIDGVSSLDSRPKLLDYASLSIAPELINQLLGIIFDGKYVQDLEINSDLNEMIGELLKYGQFSMLLPELENIGNDEDELKMFIGVRKAPTFNIDFESNKIKISLPDLVMRTQVYSENNWRDFFNFHHDMGLEIGLEKRENEIKAEVDILRHVVSGNWSENYHPHNNDFNEEGANEFFPMLFEMLLEAMNENLKIEIPVLNIGGENITIGDLKIKEGKLHIDISKLNSF